MYDAWFRQAPEQWTAYDTCDITMQNPTGEDATWTADCSTTAEKNGELALVTARYVWTVTGKVQSIAETKVHRKYSVP